MFETLAAAVEELAVPAHGEAIAELAALVDRQMAKLAEAVGEFDRLKLWELDGATSMTAWLRQHASTTGKQAASTTRTAKRLRRLPVTERAWRQGSLSGGQVQAILANLDRISAPLFAEHEAALVPTFAGLSVTDTTVAMQRWREQADSVLSRPERPEPTNWVQLSQTLDARWELRGSFDNEGGSLIETALRLATSADAAGEERAPAERRADSLVDVCRFFLDHQQSHRGGRRRPHLNLSISLQDLEAGRPGEVVGRGPLSNDAIRRVLCDCGVHRVLRGRSSVLDYGNTRYAVPVNLWNAVVERDRRCRWPGCDRGPAWCEAHHATPYPKGATSIDNLVLLCGRHHQLAHRRHWEAKLLPDATFVVTAPDGRTWETRAPR